MKTQIRIKVQKSEENSNSDENGKFGWKIYDLDSNS